MQSDSLILLQDWDTPYNHIAMNLSNESIGRVIMLPYIWGILALGVNLSRLPDFAICLFIVIIIIGVSYLIIKNLFTQDLINFVASSKMYYIAIIFSNIIYLALSIFMFTGMSGYIGLIISSCLLNSMYIMIARNKFLK